MPISSVVIIVMIVTWRAVVATASSMRDPHPPFVIRVVSWAPMTMAMTIAVVADRPMAVYPCLDRNIVIAPAAPATTVVTRASGAMVNVSIMVVMVAIIVEDGANNNASNQPPH